MAPKSRFLEWRAAFLKALARCGNVKAAALHAGVHPQTAYRARKAWDDFARAWVEALAAYRASALTGRPGAVGNAHPGEVAVAGSAGAASGHRLSPHRFGKTAREAFLTELAATGSVARAAEACGFSTTALYRRRVKEADFADAWDAALQVGKARLEGLLMEAAQRQFDPDALPLGEGAPRVSTREALEILKHGGAKGAAAKGRGAGIMVPAAKAGERRGWYTEDRTGRLFDEDGVELQRIDPDEVEAARERIAARLDRMAAQIDQEKAAAGYIKVGEDWIPPGWGRAKR